METWEIAFRTTEGDYTYKLAKWEGDDLKIDIEADRSPFDEQVFYVGSGEMLPRIDRFKIVIRETDLATSDQVLANLLYVFSQTYAWVLHDRIKYALWTNDYSIQPTLRGYILDFQFTETTGWQPFLGTLSDIATAPTPETPVIVDCGSDFIGFANQTEFNGEWAHTPAQATFSLMDAGPNAYIKFTRNTAPDGPGFLYPTACDQATRTDYNFSVDFKFVAGSGWFHSAGVHLRVGGSPTGSFSTNDYLYISVYRNTSNNGKIYIFEKSGGVTDTILDTDTSVTIDSGTNYRFSGSVVDDVITYSLKNLDTDTVIDSGSEVTTLLTSGYSGFYGETKANANDWVEIDNLVLSDYAENLSPDADTGTSDTITALGDLQARSGAGSAKVAHSQFTRAYQARNRIFDQSSPSIPLHTSTGFMNIRTSSGQNRYFFCYTEIFEVTGISGGNITIVSKGSNGLGVATYDRHFQWSREAYDQYYGVKNGDLLRFTVGSTTPTTLCSRARVLSELGLTAYESQAVRWGGPSEGLIVSNNDGLGKEIAAGYVRTGLKALTVFAYNVTDDTILSTVQNVTFTTEAELYFDFISMSVEGNYLYIKPREQGSSTDVQYWVYPITLSGIGTRVLVNGSIDVGHFCAGLATGPTDAMFTFTDEVFNLIDPSDGSIALTKAVEGQWSQHIGHVYGTIGFTTYDSAGRAAFEYSDGSGGFGLGDGWDAQGYVQMHYDAPTGDVFVIGLRGGVPELRYWDDV